jgi:hypothetical protein
MRIYPSDVANAKTAKDKQRLWNRLCEQKRYSPSNGKKGKRYRDLSTYIDARKALTNRDIKQLLALFDDCDSFKLKQIELVLRNNVGAEGARSCGALSRLMYDAPYGWSYCAGQDYHSEIEWMADFIANGFEETELCEHERRVMKTYRASFNGRKKGAVGKTV